MSRAGYDFRGRVAVVTGGSRGIGAAITAALRENGAEVCVWDRDPAEAGAVPVDVSDEASVESARADLLARYGRLDILVNNAGFAGPTVPVADYDPAVWRAIVEVNLVGTFLVSRALLPALKAAPAGRIVNIASLAGKEGTPNASAYSAAKAGVIAFTKSLGKEVAGTGLLVNAIAPAAVATSLLDQMTPEHVRTMIAKSPLGRLGEPEEVAELALWLASTSCTFSTGAVFDLSGGRATY